MSEGTKPGPEAFAESRAFLERTPEADYLLLYQRAEDLVRANEVFNASTHPVDEAVRAFIAETWADVRPLELLVDHERTDDGYVHTVGPSS